MKINVFTLCDFAKAEHGKMTIVGTFDSVFAYKAPAVHQMCALAILMRFEKIEEGQKTIRVSFIDSDGKSIMPTLSLPMELKMGPAESNSIAQFVLLIQQINLPKFGEYSIDLAVDGRLEAQTPLYLRQVPQPQLPLSN